MKKAKVKEYLLKNPGVYTVNSAHFAIVQSRFGVRWGTPLFEVSKSTIRRALDELESLECVTVGWKGGGHCYDSLEWNICSKRT